MPNLMPNLMPNSLNVFQTLFVYKVTKKALFFNNYNLVK